MKFINRLGYYLGGLALGLIILAFFLSGKRTSCDYFPEDRVLKDLRVKERSYSKASLATMVEYKIDTSQISGILKTGDVDFNRSNTNSDSCNTYLVTGKAEENYLELLFENCDSITTLRDLHVVKTEK